jgi:hypothetical protein
MLKIERLEGVSCGKGFGSVGIGMGVRASGCRNGGLGAWVQE